MVRLGYYTNAHAFMNSRGEKLGLDFDNPEKHASTDSEWRYMTTEFVLIALRAGDGRKQFEARIRFYIEHYACKCEEIRNDDVRTKLFSFLRHLVQLGGTNEQKRRFRRESR